MRATARLPGQRNPVAGSGATDERSPAVRLRF
ncbi:hypothetical protein C8D89_10452 [Actinomycetospora cinnamomea]|uniref:Uncharacterized protein n=1 Tax=Actinomycetospora cinnamomea TaxID=663609 RepID=A0A2U1FF48_9PSEU|nr:hypothetical protein C8D89_10452 [Actinomycetospora cinnamomea]